MEDLARLVLRFVLVPLGYCAGVLAGTLVILFGSWKIAQGDPTDAAEVQVIAAYGYAFAAPVLLVILLSIMWLPCAIGVLLAEAFALRSWIYHAANGGISAWVAWNMFGYMDNSRIPLTGPVAVLAAGVAGGIVYWTIAGWNAGFWKPLFRQQRTNPALPQIAASSPPQSR
jgi:hypothetical protein